MFKLVKDTFKVTLKAAGAVFGGLTGATIFLAMCNAANKANKPEEKK